MSTGLVEILPRELEFIFELKKQSSCSICLVNKSHQHVAFKVKTTSPKKYSVRPNVGIIKPKSKCDFIVTMQAPRVALPDLSCKDKFLVQCAVVPEETSDEDITSAMFSKDNGNFVEETKLRVILLTPPDSPELSPSNGVQKEVPTYVAQKPIGQALHSVESLSPPQKVTAYNVSESADQLLHSSTGNLSLAQKVPGYEALGTENQALCSVEDLSLQQKLLASEAPQPTDQVLHRDERHSSLQKATEDVSDSTKDNSWELLETNLTKVETEKDVEALHFVKDIEMRSKLEELELKLSEALGTIVKLTEERRLTAQDTEILKQELVTLRNKKDRRRVYVGFPFQFVVMVALVSIVVGYLLHG